LSVLLIVVAVVLTGGLFNLALADTSSGFTY
jgi:hypothetical protein